MDETCPKGAKIESTPKPAEERLCEYTAAVSCTDGIKNQDESDIDCGGSCPLCDNEKQCNTANDCTSKLCDKNICKQAECLTDDDCEGKCVDMKCTAVEESTFIDKMKNIGSSIIWFIRGFIARLIG